MTRVHLDHLKWVMNEKLRETKVNPLDQWVDQWVSIDWFVGEQEIRPFHTVFFYDHRYRCILPISTTSQSNMRLAFFNAWNHSPMNSSPSAAAWYILLEPCSSRDDSSLRPAPRRPSWWPFVLQSACFTYWIYIANGVKYDEYDWIQWALSPWIHFGDGFHRFYRFGSTSMRHKVKPSQSPQLRQALGSRVGIWSSLTRSERPF